MDIQEALKYAEHTFQEAFEKWLADESPSGDVEQVERQWEESFTHEELVDELQPVLALTWEVKELQSDYATLEKEYQATCEAHNKTLDELAEANRQLQEAREQMPYGSVKDALFKHGVIVWGWKTVYARPVHATPAVAVPAVPEEWQEFVKIAATPPHVFMATRKVWKEEDRIQAQHFCCRICCCKWDEYEDERHSDGCLYVKARALLQSAKDSGV